MQQMKVLIRLVIVVAIVLVVGGFVVAKYSWVFSKKVEGKILNVQRVTDPSAFLGSKAIAEQMHSYAILIQGHDGRLYTASSEDRQWQVASPGYCVKALLYRYPFWDLERANTFFNARVEELHLCPGETVPPPAVAPGSPSSRPIHGGAPPPMPPTQLPPTPAPDGVVK